MKKRMWNVPIYVRKMEGEYSPQVGMEARGTIAVFFIIEAERRRKAFRITFINNSNQGI